MQGANAWREFQHAIGAMFFQPKHQGVYPKTQFDIQDEFVQEAELYLSDEPLGLEFLEMPGRQYEAANRSDGSHLRAP